MITVDIFIEKYDWDVRAYFAISRYDIDEICHSLKGIRCPLNFLNKSIRHMMRDKKNEGFTYSNKGRRESVMVVGKTTSGKEFLNSFTHELRHLTDDIASEIGMRLSGEEVAYLTGSLAMSMGDIVCKLSCNCCRHKNFDL